jgi:hypothetical protein
MLRISRIFVFFAGKSRLGSLMLGRLADFRPSSIFYPLSSQKKGAGFACHFAFDLTG